MAVVDGNRHISLLDSLDDTTLKPVTKKPNNIMAIISCQTNKLSSKVSKSLKRRLFAKLPWLSKRNNNISNDYETLPASDPHQEEVDENALNEALEARLMELIASSPALEKPVTFRLGGYIPVVVPSNPSPDLFSFGGSFVSLTPLRYQTRCQDAQAQV